MDVPGEGRGVCIQKDEYEDRGHFNGLAAAEKSSNFSAGMQPHVTQYSLPKCWTSTQCYNVHPPSYFVVDSKVAELHSNGDEIDSTIQLILLKFLLKVNKLLIAVCVCVRACV